MLLMLHSLEGGRGPDAPLLSGAPLEALISLKDIPELFLSRQEIDEYLRSTQSNPQEFLGIDDAAINNSRKNLLSIFEMNLKAGEEREFLEKLAENGMKLISIIKERVLKAGVVKTLFQNKGQNLIQIYQKAEGAPAKEKVMQAALQEYKNLYEGARFSLITKPIALPPIAKNKKVNIDPNVNFPAN